MWELSAISKLQWKAKISGSNAQRKRTFESSIDGSKPDNEVGSGVYSRKLYLNISLHLPVYCSVFWGKWWPFTGPLSGFSSTMLLSLAFRSLLTARPPLNLFRILWITLGLLSHVPIILTYFLGALLVSHWCGSSGTVTFEETVGPTSSPELMCSFRNPLPLN